MAKEKIQFGVGIEGNISITYLNYDVLKNTISIVIERGLNVQQVEISAPLAKEIGFINPNAIIELWR